MPSQFEVVLAGFGVQPAQSCSSGTCSDLDDTYVIDRDDGVCSGSTNASPICDGNVDIEVVYIDNSTEICETDYIIRVTLRWTAPNPDEAYVYEKNVTTDGQCIDFTHTIPFSSGSVVLCTSGTSVTVEGIA